MPIASIFVLQEDQLLLTPRVKMSTTSEDSPCSACNSLVSLGDKALECDICSSWYHASCSGASTKCYELINSCEGLPWICCSCKSSLHHLSNTVRSLKDDNSALRQQMNELVQVVEALTAPSVSCETPSTPSTPSTTDSECNPTTISSSDPIISSNPTQDSISSPSSRPSLSWSTVASKRSKPAKSQPTNKNNSKSSPAHKDLSKKVHNKQSSGPEIRYLCKIPKDCSTNDVLSSLKSGQIRCEDSFIEQTVPQHQFKNMFKFLRVIFTNKSKADEFADSLKGSSLDWKLLHKQPLPPKKPAVLAASSGCGGMGAPLVPAAPVCSRFDAPVAPPFRARPPPLPPLQNLPPWFMTWMSALGVPPPPALTPAPHLLLPPPPPLPYQVVRNPYLNLR